MASMNTERASSSSSSTHQSTYDVFLSFRGEDTRNGFTSHLYTALDQKNIYTFIDDKKLERGKSISPTLMKAIKESRFAIVIFSKNYASSTWCLEELEEIIGCITKTGMTVFPIFYYVNPSDVRKQTGTFKQAFDEHEQRFKENIEKVQKWRAILEEVANMSGWHVPAKRSEAKCIQDIVKVILNKLSNTFSAPMGLIGIESRVKKLKSHLAIGSNDVRIIGIWGTGGMGKTTVARAVYGMVSNKFDACCFIANVREESKKCGLCELQKKLLKKLLMLKNLNFQDVGEGVLMMKKMLHNKKILLVLDDVTELDQLETLAGKHCWFGLGSRVILTTRDKHLLKLHQVNEIYEAEVLNQEEALQLFSLKAFKMDHPHHPPEAYGKLSQAFVDYCKGLPLALEVLGSFLFEKEKDEWESELDRLTKFGERKILNVLRISFDELQATENAIFLNIACFFNHKDQDEVKKILDYLDLNPTIGLRVLIDKSLVKLHKNKLWMHDLLQEMGRDIVCQECKDLPEKRSRLWSFEEINNMLEENTGTELIQCIVLEMREPKNVDWNPEAFSKMRNLKFLKICGVQLMRDLKHLPARLSILDWRGYPSKSLTSSSQSKCFENLKFINMRESLELTEFPNTSAFPNLDTLILVHCKNLHSIHLSIGNHKKLTILDLYGCKSLTSLPKKFEMKCLTNLNLGGCSKITEIPEFGRNMKRLHRLDLIGTAITELPTSIEHLTNLVELSLGACKNLVRLPNTIFNLKLVRKVNLGGCSKLERLPENLGNAESLKYLWLSRTAIREVPSSIGLLKHLHSLILEGCKGLSSNILSYELLPFNSLPTSPHPIDLLSPSPASSLAILTLKDCNLKEISDDIGSFLSLEELDLSGNDFDCLPESIIRLSNLKRMYLNNCTSLRSLPKLPLNVVEVEAEDCTLLEMLPDPLKSNDSLVSSLCLCNCFKLANKQSLTDRFISGTEKSLKSLSLPLSVQKIESYPCKINEIVIPGRKISEWFSDQSKGAKVNIKEPSDRCNRWMGIAFCVVFCTHHDYPTLFCQLRANGKRMFICQNGFDKKFLSDHLWLVYVTPQFFNKKSKKILWEGDADGFSHIGIKIETYGDETVKECGIRMIYKKDIEDLDQTMAQYSNSSITPYDGLECHKVERSRDDCDGAGPSGEGSSNETHGNSDSEESSEYKDCEEELSDRDESNDGLECHKVKRSRDDCDGAGPNGEGSSNETHGNSDSEDSSEYKDCNEELSDGEEDNDDSDEDDGEEDNDHWEEDSDDWEEDQGKKISSVDWEEDSDDSDEDQGKKISSVDWEEDSESDLDD